MASPRTTLIADAETGAAFVALLYITSDIRGIYEFKST